MLIRWVTQMREHDTRRPGGPTGVGLVDVCGGRLQTRVEADGGQRACWSRHGAAVMMKQHRQDLLINASAKSADVSAGG